MITSRPALDSVAVGTCHRGEDGGCGGWKGGLIDTSGWEAFVRVCLLLRGLIAAMDCGFVRSTLDRVRSNFDIDC